MTQELLVRDIMSTQVTTVEENELLQTVDQAMQDGHFRHVVVVDEDNALAGVISNRDLFLSGLLRALGYGSRSRDQALESLVAKEVMKTNPHTTSPDQPVRQAARLMQEQKIGCLPVLDGERIVGILTEWDFVRWVAQSQ